MKQKFYICKHCKNIIGMIEDSRVPIVCCGEKMTELVPNTTDATTEKHVPVVDIKDNKVTVNIGSAPHPMVDQHHISWVYIQTAKGGQRKHLDIDSEPCVSFLLSEDDSFEAAFAYCNIHGLWVSGK